MTSPIVYDSTKRARKANPAFAFVLAAVSVVVPMATGCAEEEADGFEAAYPVGASVPPLPPAPGDAPPPPVTAEGMAGPAPRPAAAPDSVVIGDGPPDPSDAPPAVMGAAPEESPPSEPPPGEPPQGDAPPDGVPPDAVAAGGLPPGPPPADTDPSALTDFRAALDPYGTWQDDPTYGTVWVPSTGSVGQDFTPYETAGHWAYDDDYTWVSDYPWGWAPFHYGRWVFAGPRGWSWIPGRRYAGAWVSWRYGWGDWSYVGWAPLAPTWGWRRGQAVGLGFVPAAPYAFVNSANLFSPRLGTQAVVGPRAAMVAAHTRPWTGTASVVPTRVPAHPTVGGPPPSMLRIPQSVVVHTAANRGVVQARAFATASPVREGIYEARTRGAMAPAYGPPVASHFGGRLGAGFTGNVAETSAARARAFSAQRPYGGGLMSYTLGRGGAASPAYSGPRFSGYSAPPGYSSAVRSGGVSTGGTSGGGGGYSSGFRSGGSSFGGSSFHGGGGGGGFHGGGGGSRGGGRGGGHR